MRKTFAVLLTLVTLSVMGGGQLIRHGKISYSMPVGSQYHRYYSAFVDGTGGEERHWMYS